jgi:hypothetical protein
MICAGPPMRRPMVSCLRPSGGRGCHRLRPSGGPMFFRLRPSGGRCCLSVVIGPGGGTNLSGIYLLIARRRHKQNGIVMEFYGGPGDPAWLCSAGGGVMVAALGLLGHRLGGSIPPAAIAHGLPLFVPRETEQAAPEPGAASSRIRQTRSSWKRPAPDRKQAAPESEKTRATEKSLLPIPE